jgi:hypothetical protein
MLHPLWKLEQQTWHQTSEECLIILLWKSPVQS